MRAAHGDARYIRRTIAAQRALEVAGRVLLAASSRRSAWWAGTATLGVAKIVENMEIGHNVMHGQWDWMNDPEIHSSTWEWDMSGSSKHWRLHPQLRAPQVHQHPRHGRRRRLRMLRVTRDQRWKRYNICNVLYNTLLALLFEWASACSPWSSARSVKKLEGPDEARAAHREFLAKAGPADDQGLRAVPGADRAVTGGDRPGPR